MTTVAPCSAKKGRLRPSFFLLLGAACAVSAQQPVFRCGQEYTNAPMDASRCERLTGQAVTVIPGTRVQATAPAASGSTANTSTPAVTKVDAAGQRQRDDMARAIVSAELDKARQRHAGLQQDYRKAQGKSDDAQLKAAVDRAQRDIDSLQRELDRRSPASAQP